MEKKTTIDTRKTPHFEPMRRDEDEAGLMRLAASRAATHMGLHVTCDRPTCRKAGKCIGTDINRDTRYCHGLYGDEAHRLVETLFDFLNDVFSARGLTDLLEDEPPASGRGGKRRAANTASAMAR